MSMQMSGVTRHAIEHFWQGRNEFPAVRAGRPAPFSNGLMNRPKPLFAREQILEFALGRPSKAFGDRYAEFDAQRRIARLPAPPFSFMDRVTSIEPKPWVLKSGGWIEAQYDVPAEGWYFAADRSGVMPFCVLLEIALQPCGWLAAYAGSALRSQKDLKFRNLGGRATLHQNLIPGAQTLTMRTRIDRVSEAADMIIENFEFEVLGQQGPVYTGTTYFGFFTDRTLAQQVGLREAIHLHPGDGFSGGPDHLPDEAPFQPDDVPPSHRFYNEGLRMPARALRMIDAIECFDPQGGPHGLGYIRGHKRIDPSEWFFKAHFYQDPVCPGSLGIESFLQLLKYAALQLWTDSRDTHGFEMLCGQTHEWQYRGQVIPSNHTVIVEAVVTQKEAGSQPVIMADGWLQVDGLYIYKMNGFGLKLVNLNR